MAIHSHRLWLNFTIIEKITTCLCIHRFHSPGCTCVILKPQVLKWARENSCPWDEEVCASAAAGGHLALLKYCWANRCPWNEYTCELAAEGGHLEVLKWARSKGCPWDEDVCAFAAEEGHMEVRPSGIVSLNTST